MRTFKIFKTTSYSRQLKTQLMASFLIITLVIMAIGFLTTYIFVSDIFKKKNENYTLRMFHKDEININNLTDEVEQLFKFIIIDNDYQMILRGNFNSRIEEEDAKINVFNTFSNIIKSNEYIDSIYSYDRDGVMLGASLQYNDYLFDRGKGAAFYKSKLYSNAVSAGFSPIWPGAFTNDYLNFVEGRDYISKLYVLPALRKAKILDQGRDSYAAVLAININEAKLSSMYNDKEIDPSSVMYIVDQSGRIISHKNKAMIGTLSGSFSSIDNKKSYGSTTIRKGSQTLQVIYYRLSKNGWMMINEIPVSVVLKDINIIRNIILIVFFSCLASVFVLSLYWIYRLTRPLNELSSAMKMMEKGSLGIRLEDLPKNELGLLGSQFNRMSKSIAELMEKNLFVEKQKRELEVEALQMQINPHFIFNTLNVIKWMAIIANNFNVEESIEALGRLLMPVFRDVKPTWTLREEMKYTESYLEIINLRYGEKIKVSYDIQSELEEYSTIKFMLQPLIENSFTHGFNINKTVINIEISAKEIGDLIEIRIKDDASGFADEGLLQELVEELEKPAFQTKTGNGIGISNVNRRIKLNYGQDYGISINSFPGEGTELIIHIPKVFKA